MRRLIPLLFSVLGLALPLQAQDRDQFEIIATPAGPASQEPFLFADDSGQLVMSWIEEAEGGAAVMLAILEGEAWTAPIPVATSPGLFVNWADSPSVARLADGTLVVHWLQRGGSGTYVYDVNIAFSRDGGRSWSAPVVPHLDGTATQHGFVTLVPDERGVVVVWLDGRAYDETRFEPGAVRGAMQLRSAVIGPDGTASPDFALDLMTCSCCQTSAVRSGGDVLVVYRDRSPDEIRDISIVRRAGDIWSDPVPVHRDGWEIGGCPVNGPAIAARGDDVAVAWFTGSGDVAAVKLAFSDDAGASFDAPVRIDLGQPVGRVDLLMIGAGRALISWVEWQGAAEHLFICEATRGGCDQPRHVATNSSGGSVNFPSMALTPDAVFLAWTQPMQTGTDTVRLVRWDR